MSSNLQKLRIGVIGCGHWGKNYVRNFSSMADASVSAVCDLDKSRLEAMRTHYPSVALYEDYREMIDSGKCDAVVVATVASTHYEITRYALENNLHVIAEKPLTLRVEESDDLVRIADERKLILLVAHTFLYNPSIRKIKQLIQDGALGDIYYLQARRTHLGLIREDVNSVWDLAPHDISIFLYLLGEKPTLIQALGTGVLKKTREDVAFINFCFPSDIIANIVVSWADSNKERFLAIVGSKARVVFNDLDNLEPVRIFHKGISIDGDDNNFGEFQYLLRDGDIISPKIVLEEPLKVLCRSFIGSIIDGTPTVSNGKLGRDVVEILCGIEKALAEQKESYSG